MNFQGGPGRPGSNGLPGDKGLYSTFVSAIN